MENNTNNSATGLELLLIAFLVLKLTHVIDWSWWWVTAPLWGGTLVALVFLVIHILIDISRRRKRKV